MYQLRPPLRPLPPVRESASGGRPAPTATTSERQNNDMCSSRDRSPSSQPRAEHHRATGRLCRCRGNDTSGSQLHTARGKLNSSTFHLTSPRRLGPAPSTREEDAGPQPAVLLSSYCYTYICNYIVHHPTNRNIIIPPYLTPLLFCATYEHPQSTSCSSPQPCSSSSCSSSCSSL